MSNPSSSAFPPLSKPSSEELFTAGFDSGQSYQSPHFTQKATADLETLF